GGVREPEQIGRLIHSVTRLERGAEAVTEACFRLAPPRGHGIESSLLHDARVAQRFRDGNRGIDVNRRYVLWRHDDEGVVRVGVEQTAERRLAAVAFELRSVDRRARAQQLQLAL